MATNAERRGDPRALWPEVRSIVVLGINYGPQEDPLAILQHRSRGAISVYARGDDYHDLIKSRLKQIGRWLLDRAGGDIKVFVDTAPVMEKPLAAAAGLGWHASGTFRSGGDRVRSRTPCDPALLCHPHCCRARKYAIGLVIREGVRGLIGGLYIYVPEPIVGSLTIGGAQLSRWRRRRRGGVAVFDMVQRIVLFEDHLPKAHDAGVAFGIHEPYEIEGLASCLDYFKHANRTGCGKLLMLDEPSMGLAPAMADSIFERIRQIHHSHGLTILMVEQRVVEALQACDHGYVLETGRVVLEGAHDTLISDPRVRRAYLGA